MLFDVLKISMRPLGLAAVCAVLAVKGPDLLRLAASIPMTVELRSALEAMRKAGALEPGQGLSDIARRLDDMLAAKGESEPFQPAGAWTTRIAADITPAWREVLEAGAQISGSDASNKWRQAAAARVAAMGRETLCARGKARQGRCPLLADEVSPHAI